jgi:hypothetical protein
MKKWRKIFLGVLLLSVMPFTADIETVGGNSTRPSKSRDFIPEMRIWFGEGLERFAELTMVAGLLTVVGVGFDSIKGPTNVDYAAIVVGLVLTFVVGPVLMQISIWCLGTRSLYYIRKEG